MRDRVRHCVNITSQKKMLHLFKRDSLAPTFAKAVAQLKGSRKTQSTTIFTDTHGQGFGWKTNIEFE